MLRRKKPQAPEGLSSRAETGGRVLVCSTQGLVPHLTTATLLSA